MKEVATLISVDEFIERLRTLKKDYNIETNNLSLKGGRGFVQFFDRYLHLTEVSTPVSAISSTNGMVEMKAGFKSKVAVIDEFTLNIEYEPLVDYENHNTLIFRGLPISSFKYAVFCHPYMTKYGTLLKDFQPLLNDKEWEIIEKIRQISNNN